MPARRTLALDVGDRRVGVALSDPLGLIAQPLLTLYRKTLHADLRSIARLIRRHEVAVLVVGNPLHADGTPSRQSAKALGFAEALFAEHPALEHHFLDERHTTQEAHARLDVGGRRETASDRLQRQGRIDQVAATVLLESFLSRERGPALLPDPDAL